MRMTQRIAQNLLAVTKGGNWTEVNIADTLEKLTYEDAQIVTRASVNTIASLIHHLRFWNRLMVQRINGIKIEIPAINGFDVHALRSIADWEELKADHILSAEELAAAILSVDETKLDEPILEGYSSFYQNLQGMVEHAHYHLGQMVIIKGALDLPSI